MAGVEGAAVGQHQRLRLVDDPVQALLLGEEPGLARRDDDDVEQVAPGGALRAEGVEGVGHHVAGVGPVAVGDEQELLPGGSLVEKGPDDLGIGLEEPVGIGEDLGLELAGEVRLVEGLVYPAVQLAVAAGTRQPPGVEGFDELGPQARPRQLEHRVHELEPVVGEVDDSLGVDRPLLVEGKHGGPVLGPHHVSEPGCLDQIAELEVEDQAEREGGGVEA